MLTIPMGMKSNLSVTLIMPESPYLMLPVEEALAIVLKKTDLLTPKTIALCDADGLILLADVVAQEPLPPFPAAVKDGYAVVAADGSGIYKVIGEVTAGHVADFRVEPGTVAYITTGAPMPNGADAVVMVEQTEPLPDSHVQIDASVRSGDDVRAVGVDIRAGEVVLQAGDQLGPAEVGLLATVGATQVSVYGRPLVGTLSTGDEVIEAGDPLAPGQIRDSNRPTLRAAIQAMGGEHIDLGIGRDDAADLSQRVTRGLNECDILLTSGGVSMGEMDLLKPIFEHAGEVHFGRIRMKPGKPLTFATVEVGGRQRLIFGLPGNPVSSLVTFYLFVVPAIRKMAGWPDPHLRRVQAFTTQALMLDPQRPEYHRATLRWDAGSHRFLASSTGSQASSRLLSMRTANALLELPQRAGELAAGSMVSALLIGEFG